MKTSDEKILSEEFFTNLLSSNPLHLLELIVTENLRPAELTFAAEVAGRIPSNEIKCILINLLNRSSPMVREGTIYGLAHHLTEEVRSKLQEVAQNDVIEEVRQVAFSVLEKT